MSKRTRRLVVVLGLALVAVTFVVGAVLADGFKANDVLLHDAAVWTARFGEGSIGRINTDLKVIDTKLSVDSSDFDLHQSGTAVLTYDAASATVTIVDVVYATTRHVAVERGSTVALGGRTVAIFNPTTGSLFVLPFDRVAGHKAGEDKASHKLPPTSVVAVDVDGMVHAVDTKAGRVTVFDGAGRVVRTSTDDGIAGSSGARVTTVGSVTVVAVEGRLVAVGKGTTELPTDDLVLQQPGPAADSVLVADGTRLLEVPLSSGAPEVVTSGGSGDPIAPVRVGRCVHAAWAASPVQIQRCGEGSLRTVPFDKPAGTRLAFRVNRGRVVLNSMSDGDNLLLGETKTERISDWDQALSERKETDEEKDEVLVEDLSKIDRSGENRPPVAEDDTAATRLDRPVIVRVLANDSDPDGDVLAVEPLTDQPQGGASAAVVSRGTAIQVTPAAGSTQTISFGYTITDGRGEQATARVTVVVRPHGENAPPTVENDVTVVEAGQSVTHNVLRNDADPDGDVIVLAQVTAPQGNVQWRPDGTVVFTAPTDARGRVTLPYAIEDEQRERATGELHVDVREPDANLPPKARNDYAETFVGRPVEVDVLANDSDPNGDQLLLVNVEEEPGATVTWTPAGTVRVTSDQVGPYTLAYRVSDARSTSIALVRIDVRRSPGGSAPVAVRDDVALRPGVPTLVEVLANDVDADGDTLVVRRATRPTGADLAVEVIDHRALRLTTGAAFGDVVVVEYVASDGSSEAIGKVVVRQVPLGTVNQPPTVRPDEASVRAGNGTAIPVLANDTDPDGDTLRIDALTPLAADEGILFVEGDELRYLAPSTSPGTVTARYTVVDSAQNRADGTLTIHVLPRDAQNRPPIAPTVEARVFLGRDVRIPVPLVGADPDGDVVQLVSVVEPPKLGDVVEVGTAHLLYRAGTRDVGTDRFTFRLRDAGGLEATGVAYVGVAPPPDQNSPPVAVADTAAVAPGEMVTIPVLRNDTDPDGDTLVILGGDEGPSAPRVGEVSIGETKDSLQYRSTGEEGVVSFDYGVSDGKGGTARAAVSVTVGGGGDPVAPIARDDLGDPASAASNVRVPVLDNDEDPDGDVKALRVEPLGLAGATVDPDGAIRFVMPPQSVTFAYRVVDQDEQVAFALVQVPLIPNRPPVAEFDTAETDAGKTVVVDVLQNDKDPDGDELRLVRVVDARNGTAEATDSKVAFTPADRFGGEAGFTYEVTDGTTAVVGTARVTVKGGNVAPVLPTLRVEVPAGASREIDLAAAVEDGNTTDSHRFSDLEGAVDGVEATLNGSVVRFDAKDDARGATGTYTVTVSDGIAIVEGVIEVAVVGIDKPPPIAVDDAAETDQDLPVDIAVLANDVDPVGKGLEVVEIGAVSDRAGRVELLHASERAGALRFTPRPGFHGQATFTYTISETTVKDLDRRSSATVVVTVFGRPDAPTPPTGYRGNGHVVLTWGVPANNGAPITAYVVESDTGISREFTSNSATIDGLTNAKPYRFRVLARNRAGDSPRSDYSEALVPDTLADIPQAPTVAFGDAAIDVSWPVPINHGSPISRYVVEVSPADANGVSQRDVTGNGLTWAPLRNGTAYTFRVQAVNDAGASEFSPASVPEVPAGVPVAAAAPTATRGDGQITVAWVEPGTNGAPIDGYRVHVLSNGAEVNVVEVPDGTLRAQVVGGLNNGTSYAFKVSARNKAGWGAASASSASVTPAREPDAIGSVTAAEGDRVATLSFSVPANNGSAITRYEVRVNGGAATTLASDRVVRNLQNGTSYRFDVRACNDVGCNASWSPQSNAVIPFGAPATPSVSASASGTTINWSWPVPSGNGRPISHYELRLDGSLIDGSFGGTSFSRGGFGYSETHTLYVVAVNTGGARSGTGSASATTAPPPAPTYRDVRTTDDLCPEDNSTGPPHYSSAGPSCTVTWVWQDSTVRIYCYENWSATYWGLTTWWRFTNSQYTNWYLPDIYLTGDKSGLGGC